MQKAEAEHSQVHGLPAASQGGGMALESLQSDRIAQLSDKANGSAQVVAQRRMVDSIQHSPRVTAQAVACDGVDGNPISGGKSGVAMPNSPSGEHAVVMMKKDAALAELRSKESGWTATKIIKPKNGNKGVFRFPMNGDNIDTFVGTNSVPSGITIPSEHSDAENPGSLYAPVADHDLSKKYGHAEGLSDTVIRTGARSAHFAHGDEGHGIHRENSLTWHHKAKVGHMELIDMNVHGAFWHYGGIAGWSASLVDPSDGDDDAGASS
ncbi:HNH endonuclease [Fulvimonas sp. R45]|uniref:HNH endonuclease n=1 Tax=Fulvimonas sp. R45 TaxID=3045937 RepID=UPI0026605A97|nr:HNH endonuclease [Fulvimonas sp. R45]MDO1529058.1 HNH endonuclease [Fulvimonas sp. R45]